MTDQRKARVAAWATGAVLAAGLGWLGVAPAPAQTPRLQAFAGIADTAQATTVYVAREFITMDPERPRVEAVAVRDGRFIAVGTRADVAAAAGPKAALDERFAGKVATPGFIEPHAHPVLAALAMSTEVIAIEDWDAMAGVSAAVRDPETYQERLLRALADHHRAKAGPFVSWGYHPDFHGGMSRALLDELLPSVPVIIWHRSCREFYLNSAALEATGIDADVVAGLGEVARARVDLATGHLAEQGAIAVLDRLAPLIAPPERLRQGLEYMEVYYHRNGITLACEPGAVASRSLQDAINAVYSDSATPFDHCFIADGKRFAARHPDDAAALIAATREVLAWGAGRTRYLPRQVRLYADDAPSGDGPRLRAGGNAGQTDSRRMHPGAFDAAFQAYWDAGYQIQVQYAGKAGLELALASLEAAMQRRPRNDHRTLLAPLAFAAPAQVARWAALGGSVGANLEAVEALAGRYAADGIARERANDMVPMGAVLAQGMTFSLHSAMPVAPAKPIRMVWAAVNRLTPEGRIMGLDHRVPRQAALRAVTLGAAHALRQERDVGSIEVGKRANLTILEASPLDVPPTWIKDIPVWGTMLDGRVQPVPPAPVAADAGSAIPTGPGVDGAGQASMPEPGRPPVCAGPANAPGARLRNRAPSDCRSPGSPAPRTDASPRACGAGLSHSRPSSGRLPAQSTGG